MYSFCSSWNIICSCSAVQLRVCNIHDANTSWVCEGWLLSCDGVTHFCELHNIILYADVASWIFQFMYNGWWTGVYVCQVWCSYQVSQLIVGCSRIPLLVLLQTFVEVVQQSFFTDIWWPYYLSWWLHVGGVFNCVFNSRRMYSEDYRLDWRNLMLSGYSSFPHNHFFQKLVHLSLAFFALYNIIHMLCQSLDHEIQCMYCSIRILVSLFGWEWPCQFIAAGQVNECWYCYLTLHNYIVYYWAALHEGLLSFVHSLSTCTEVTLCLRFSL